MDSYRVKKERFRRAGTTSILVLGTLVLGTSSFLITPTVCFAQTITSGDITGRVTDASGAVLAGATVTLKNLGTGATQAQPTSSGGDYRFSLLNPGQYSITVEGSSLRASADLVAVNVGQATRVDLTAKPQGSSQTVTVSSNQPLLQTQDGNISTTFDTRQVETLPLPGGDIASVPNTAPGVNFSVGGGYGGFSAFGLPGTSNLYTTNGADEVDAYFNINNTGASNLSLGANDVAEVAVVSNGYTGQYGRLAGTQVNYTTKSGTNQFHGNALYYYNGTVLNSNGWFNNNTGQPRPHAVANQWAGSIGGPIWRDKLFGYFDDEGLRYVLPGGGSLEYIPTASFLAAAVANVSARHPGEAAYYQTIQKLYNNSIAAKTATSVAGSCGDPTGDPTLQTIITATGGACASEFVSTANSLNTEGLFSFRIDQVIGQNDRAFYRVKHDYGVQATGTDPLNAAFNANSSQPSWEGQGNESHIFSPSVVNSFTIGALYYSAIFGPTNIKNALQVFPTTLLFQGLPKNYANLGGTDYNYPQGRNVTQYQFLDDLSVIKGIHSFKFGFNFRRNLISDFRAGVLTSGRTLFTSLDDLYNGELSSASGYVNQRFPSFNQVPISFLQYGIYGQDQIAVTPKLNLTLSLRADHNSNFSCGNNCFSRFNTGFENVSHSIDTPYNASINSAARTAFGSTDAVIIEPRLGFSYTPEDGTPKTVIRGGVGLFTDLPPGQLSDNFITNAPGIASFTIPGNADAPVTVVPGDASSGYGTAAASAAAFKSGFANGATYAQLRAATNNRFSRPGYNVANSTIHTPKYVEASLEVQRSFGSKDVVDVIYAANYGYDLLEYNSNLNAFAALGDGFGGLASAPADPRFRALSQLTNLGHSNYNGVTASYRHQFTKGLQLQANYTYSHAMDTVSNGGIDGFVYNASTGIANVQSVVDPINVSRLNYASADYDVRHSLNGNYVYQVPFAFHSGLLNTLAGGWTVAGTFFYRTGYPYSVVDSLLTATETSSYGGGTALATQVAPVSAHSCKNPNSLCLPASAFVGTGVATTFGNRARNSFGSPNYFDTDMQLNKTTKIGERVSFKVGAQAYNLTNHPNFGQPDNNIADGDPASGGSFGQILGTLTPYSSPYGSFQGANGSSRILQVFGAFQF